MSRIQLNACLGNEVSLLDIANAFIQGTRLSQPKGKLFVEAPRDGLPGVAPGSLIELVRPIYGLNDAPMAWNRELCDFLVSQGWVPLECDSCFMVLRGADGCAEGILLMHVDESPRRRSEPAVQK